MARIAGVDLPKDKRVEVGLTYIYGIGLSTAKQILADTGVNPDVRCKDLTDDDQQKFLKCDPRQGTVVALQVFTQVTYLFSFHVNRAIKLRSPKPLSTRPTGHQNLVCATKSVGYAACLRL